MIKGVIFDLDGVIVSTDSLHYLAWKKMADKEDIYFDKTINKRLLGVSREQSLKIILERAKREYSNKEKADLCDFKNGIFVDLLDGLSPKNLLSNVENTLNELKRKSIKIAIASSSRNAEKILKKTGIFGLFDAVCGGNDITHSKPNPEVFLLAAKRLKLEPKDCIIVEDAVAGIEAGKSGGFTCCAINDATKHERADYRLNDIADLLKIV